MDTSADNVANEVRAAIDNADKHNSSFAEKIRRYHGTGYLRDCAVNDPLNYDFEYVSLMLGKTVASNPRVKATVFGTQEEREQGFGLQQGANRWIRSSNYRAHLHRVAVDFYLLRGVTTVTLDPVPGCDPLEPLLFPNKHRIRPEDFFWDSRGQSWEDALILGHKIREPKDDLIARIRAQREASGDDDDGWDLEAIEEMGRESPGPGGDFPTRHELEYYEVWFKNEQVPLAEDDDPDDFHGMIVTLGSLGEGNVKARKIREDRNFFGVPTGPYNFFECHFVPNDPAPLAGLVAVEGSIQNANAHARALDENKANWKKFSLVEATGEDDTTKLTNAKHGETITLSSVDKTKIVDIENGGPSELQFLMEQHSENRVKNILGMYDAQRGNVSGEATATENALADSASTARSQFQASKFEDGVAMELRAVTFYLYRSPSVVFRLADGSLFVGGSDIDTSIRVARANGLLPTHDDAGEPIPAPDFGASAETRAIRNKLNKKIKWSQIDIQLEPYSMERTSELVQMRRLVQGWQLLPQIVDMLTKYPFLNGKRILDTFGDSLNWPDFGGGILDPAALQQFQLLQAQLALAAAQPQSGTSGQPVSRTQTATARARRPESGLPGNFTGAELAAANR